MRAVVQRVSQASVVVDGKTEGTIDLGFMILLGIGTDDTREDIDYLVSKISQLRVFGDVEGKMNLDIKSVNGNCLVISQFTLYANTKKGNRPSFIEAAAPEQANHLYEIFCAQLSSQIGKSVEKGIFGADMKVSLINDGPVTILYDTKNKN
ncbi:MAG: D-aminoacyl-tRNA deacylase [Chitinophagales bacterium]|jgi:D-tyrosyl-tRNA(Tyr) deacylase|nr:D-aminoacyl-tRNA deacylase [Sphingobacteriales bacterium]